MVACLQHDRIAEQSDACPPVAAHRVRSYRRASGGTCKSMIGAGRWREGPMHRAVGCVLLLLSVAFGLVSAAPALIAMLAVTQSRAISVASGVLVLAGVTGLVALCAARLLVQRPEPQRAIAVVVTCSAAVLFAVFLWWLVLQPGPTTTPSSMVRPEFWDLPTGSRIAYEAVYADGGGLPTPVILVH